MPVTFNSFLQTAKFAKECANDLKAVRNKLRTFMDHHNANGFSTASDEPKPSYINENASGNIDTLEFSRQDYSAIANLANQIETFFTDGIPAKGDYKTVIEKVADA